MLTFDPNDRRYLVEGVPFDHLARVRREQPICATPQGAWYLSRYELVESALRDVETFRADLGALSGLAGVEEVPEDELFLSEIIEPRHREVRRLFNAIFGPHRLPAYEPVVQRICEALVDSMLDRPVADLHGDYAALIPGRVMAHIMGLPLEMADRFDEWSRDGTIMARPSSPGVGRGQHPLQNALADELRRRRRLPEMPDDVFGRLASAEIEGLRLTDQQIVTQLHFMIQAGVHTTRGLLTHLVHRLLADPALASRLRKQPELLEAFVEESLRHDAPVQRTSRRATRDATIGGIEIHTGDWLEMGIASANRDEDVYDEPEAFRLDRPDPRRHLAFGAGSHVCPGSSLARLEGATAVRVLLSRCASLEPVDGALYPPIPGNLGHAPIPSRVRGGVHGA